MKLKTIIIIVVVVVIIFIAVRYMGKNKEGDSLNDTSEVRYVKLDAPSRYFTANHARDALLRARSRYGKDFAALMERIYRLETNHFQSGQYKGTGTPGMEYGKWGKWILNYLNNPVYLLKYTDPKRGDKYFIVFPDVDNFIDLFHHYVYKIRGGNWAAWNSLDETKQASYRNAVNNVTNTIIT